jgi:hypothetical protein
VAAETAIMVRRSESLFEQHVMYNAALCVQISTFSLFLKEKVRLVTPKQYAR